MADDDKPVRGHLEAATEEGFAKLLMRANKAHAAGFTIIGIVPVGEKIGAVFVRLRPQPAPRQADPEKASLVGE